MKKKRLTACAMVNEEKLDYNVIMNGYVTIAGKARRYGRLYFLTGNVTSDIKNRLTEKYCNVLCLISLASMNPKEIKINHFIFIPKNKKVNFDKIPIELMANLKFTALK